MELEIKARVKNIPALRRRLKSIGAQRVGRVEHHDTYYSLYKKPYTKKIGSVVRVRFNATTKRTLLEFHTGKSNIAAEETEVEVMDYQMIRKILHLMGARPEVRVIKKREIFRKGNIEIVIDIVKGLGQFVEVEIMGANTLQNRTKLKDMLALLNVPRQDIFSNAHYNNMLLQKKGKKHAYF